MATQLKNLKFSDYTLKGETNEGSTHFVLGRSDSLGYMSGTGGSAVYSSIIDNNGSGIWLFHGVADEAGTVTCYSYDDPSTVAGTYKLLVNGSGAIMATLVN